MDKLDGCFFCFLFYLSFLLRTFTNHRTVGEGGRYFFNSSLPLSPASQTLRNQPDDYCRGLTSAHNQQLDLNQEPLVSVSKHKSLTTKLRVLYDLLGKCNIIWNKISADVKKEFDRKPVYYKNVLKTKIRSYGVEPTNFYDK